MLAVVVVTCLAVLASGRQADGLTLGEPGRASDKVGAALQDEDLYSIPQGFLLGAGVSACQAEGAWDADGKAESVLDRMAHVKNNPVFHSSPDVSSNHYHRYKEDLAMAKDMKFTSHRFSISWSRVLPKGDTSHVNQEGVRFYHDYIDEIKRLGMEPMVTMLHFDQPYTLEVETGGWTKPAMVDKYVEYAGFLFAEFGSKVKYWTTVNEPNMYCNYFPTVMNLSGLAPKDDMNIYKCMHNMVIAHMKTYRLYKEKYYKDQQGFVGTSALLWPSIPATTSAEDVVAADTFNTVFAGTVLHPLVYGDYPPLTRYIVDSRSKALGLAESRLPEFTPEEKEQLVGTTDFIALNVYSSFVAAYDLDGSGGEVTPALLGPIMDDMAFLKLSGGMASFNTTDASMMRTTLLWAWNAYHVPIVIAENGFGDMTGVGLRDSARSVYHSSNLRSLLQTMKQFDVKVIAYYVWALLDVFEFSAGYDERPFGLIQVDYKDASLKRTLKDSSQFFVEIGNTGRVPYIAPPLNSASGVQHVCSWLMLSISFLVVNSRFPYF